jgi:hypothetical protein
MEIGVYSLFGVLVFLGVIFHGNWIQFLSVFGLGGSVEKLWIENFFKTQRKVDQKSKKEISKNPAIISQPTRPVQKPNNIAGELELYLFFFFPFFFDVTLEKF